MAHGKKYREASQRYDKNTSYPAQEALELVKTLASSKFDETVEVVYGLGIDPRKADPSNRGGSHMAFQQSVPPAEVERPAGRRSQQQTRQKDPYGCGVYSVHDHFKIL